MSLAEKFGDALKAIAPKVVDKVVEALVEREVNKRSAAVVEVFDKLRRLETDRKKLKPDLLQFNDAGEQTTAAWSKDSIDRRKKLDEQIKKHTNAIAKALDDGDYSLVYDLQNKSGGGEADG